MREIARAPDDAPSILSLGKGPGGARYLEGVLESAYRVTRVYGSAMLADTEYDRTFDAYRLVVLNDYPAQHVGDEADAALVEAVTERGVGLLMIGGWASFAAPRGPWHGTRVAGILPVDCAESDDRTNVPLGTVLVPAREPHPAIATIQRTELCVVVGYNAVMLRPGADVLIAGHHLSVDPDGPTPRLEPTTVPMLSVWERGRGRVAALAPDMSPHWAGGVLDWGSEKERLKLPTGNEVGYLYRAFLLDLCAWLEKK